jgi:hypothetical protein
LWFLSSGLLTHDKLVELFKESQYGKNVDAFSPFFVRTTDADPRCKCGKLIREHPATSALLDEPKITVRVGPVGPDGIEFERTLTAKMVERTDGSQWFRIGMDGEKLGVSDFAKLLKEHQSDDVYELISVQKTAFDGFMKHEADVQERDAFECVLLENEGYTKLSKKKCVFHPKTSLAIFNEKLPAALNDFMSEKHLATYLSHLATKNRVGI